MATESRLHKTLLNAQVGLLFFFLTLVLSFFSRKIFLDNLGADFIGLTGTLASILGFLNLAELGISNSISFFLYKPLQEKNQAKIMEILSVFGYLYRMIGFIIGGGGIVISLFFPLIFSETIFEMGIVYFAFFSFLGSSLIGYFINYRQILLTADQKNYVVAAYFQTATIVKTCVQIALAVYYKNLYVWAGIEFVFGIISCIILNWKINKEYPWLRTDISSGKNLLKKYPDILTKTKQIFVHKMKDFLLRKSDEILIFAFATLKMVAFYGNYMMIVNKLIVLVNTALDGVFAGVGNLIAEGNKQNTMKVFWELMSIRYFVIGTIIFGLYYLVNPFIIWWLGEEYLLSDLVVILLLLNIYLVYTGGVVDTFIHTHGLYSDTWAAWVELGVNLGVTFALAPSMGVAGILLGKITSVLIILVFWKPYFLFSKGLKVSYWDYWKDTLKYLFIYAFSFGVMALVIPYFPINPNEGLWQLVVYAVMVMVPFVLLFFSLLLFMARGMRHVVVRFPVLRLLGRFFK